MTGTGTAMESALYVGKVVHKRLRPVIHELEYRVASVLVDVDALPAGLGLKLLSHNRFNLFSLYDADHGSKGETQSLSGFAWAKLQELGIASDVQRILMLSYPRILGYAFNPLTTFYGLDASGHVRGIIYEVHNTFGGRHCYGAGPFAAGDDTFAKVEKVFRVSPFNGIDGHYGLRATAPGENITVGVALTTADGPVLKAYFSGTRKPLSDGNLLKLILTMPLMNLKVMAGIHWEALKLWSKGLKVINPSAQKPPGT
jgi:uncharacterized protein